MNETTLQLIRDGMWTPPSLELDDRTRSFEAGRRAFKLNGGPIPNDGDSEVHFMMGWLTAALQDRLVKEAEFYNEATRRI